MTRIGVRELRQNASRYLAMAKAGQTVEVTEHGHLIALLVPPSPAQTGRERLIASGRLVPADAPNGRIHNSSPIAFAGATSQELLDLERGDS